MIVVVEADALFIYPILRVPHHEFVQVKRHRSARPASRVASAFELSVVVNVVVVAKVPVRENHKSRVNHHPHAGVAHVPSPLQNVVEEAPVPLFRLDTGRFHVTHVDKGSHVQLVSVPDDGVPSAGVTRVGEVAFT